MNKKLICELVSDVLLVIYKYVYFAFLIRNTLRLVKGLNIYIYILKTILL